MTKVNGKKEVICEEKSVNILISVTSSQGQHFPVNRGA